ncbi:MAG: DUF5674 family protein [Candidatus Paceibacterota bacterium]
MILKEKVKKEELQIPFTKAVVDVEKEIIAINCELHIDCAEELMENGSQARNLWGFNIYPDFHLDFVSLINIRPVDDNRSMEIKKQEIRDKIEKIFQKFI